MFCMSKVISSFNSLRAGSQVFAILCCFFVCFRILCGRVRACSCYASCPLVCCVDVCCSVVFYTLVGGFVFSVMWSELLMISAISCSLWSSMYECQRVECAFTAPVMTECGMFVMY